MSTKTSDVRVVVNGKEIELNGFVKSVIGSTVFGMVSSLRLDGVPKQIEISVRARRSRKAKEK